MPAKPSSDRTGMKDYPISSRVEADTWDVIQGVMADYGLSMSRAIELMLKRHKPIDKTERDHAALVTELRADLSAVQDSFDAVLGELEIQGRNVNQIAAVANATGKVPDTIRIEGVDVPVGDITDRITMDLGMLTEQLKRVEQVAAGRVGD